MSARSSWQLLNAVLLVCAGCPSSPGRVPLISLGAPQEVSASAASHEITLTWAPVEGATAYAVYYASEQMWAGPNHEGFARVSHATSPLTIRELSNRTRYRLIVTAWNDAGEGPDSVQVLAMPGLSGPSAVRATPWDAAVVLEWEPVAGAAWYSVDAVIESSPGVWTSAPGSLFRSTTSELWNVFTGAENGRMHVFGVTAWVGGELTLRSPEVSATPSAGATACLTLPATSITDSSLIVNALVVNPPARTTSVSFEVGATTQYGTTTPASATAVPGVVTFSFRVAPVSGDTEHHYRVVAESALGTCRGENRVARTWRSPEVLVSGLDRPSALVLGAEDVYWAELGANRIARVSKTGGQAVTVVAAGSPTALVGDDAALYVAEVSGICVIDPQGATSTPLSTDYSDGNEHGLVLAGPRLCWGHGAYVYALPLSGGTPAEVVSGASLGFDADDSAIYWVDSVGRIWAKPFAPEAPSVRVVDRGGPLLVAGGWIYYGDGTAIRRVPVDGGAPVELAPTGGWPIAADETHVYFTHHPLAAVEPPLLSKVPLGGGPVTPLAYAAGLGVYSMAAGAWPDRGAIAVDDTHIYWIRQDQMTPYPPIASIVRTPKD
jgi:hypothetical protein